MVAGEINKRWCDECKGVIHAPWCSSYEKYDIDKERIKLQDQLAQRMISMGAREVILPVSEQPATRGGGDEWRTAGQVVPDCEYAIVGMTVIHKRASSELVALIRDKQVAAQIVEEHNQHQSLVAERESYAQLLKAAKSLVAMNNCNYDRSVMRERGGFIELEKAVEAIEQRSTSE